MMISKEKTSKTIYVGKEAYFYLNGIMREQRGRKPLSEEAMEKMWNRLNKNEKGLREVYDGSFGGGDGTYNGRWWSWSVDTIKEMLDEKGFAYEEGGELKYIAISI